MHGAGRGGNSGGRLVNLTGSNVTLICNPGERYGGTYYDAGWIPAQGQDTAPYVAALKAFARKGC